MRVDAKNKEFIKPFEYLSRYLYAINDVDGNTSIAGTKPKTVWQCWLQGEKAMPELVRGCTESVKKYCADTEIVLITNDNYQEYIKVPDYIIEKYSKGIIPKAHFTDVIRLMLLNKYGGVWIDSTVLLTGKLPAEVFSSDFFTYKNTLGLNFEYVRTIKDLEIMCNFMNTSLMLPSMWLIASDKNNLIISGWLKLLSEYWKYENALVDYFIMDYFFVLLLLNNQACRDMFLNTPTYLTTPCEILQAAMPEEYSKEVFEHIKSITPIHKLTLKYSPDDSIKDRLYHHIINDLL